MVDIQAPHAGGLAVRPANFSKVAMAAALMGGLSMPAAAGHLNSQKIQARYRKLETELQRSHGTKRARLLAKLAQLDIEQAYASFQTQKVLAGNEALNLAQQHAQQAMLPLAQEAARGKSKDMRKVELRFHSISFGLSGLMNIAPYRIAPRIRAVRAYIGQLQSKLLQWMFGGGISLAPNPAKH